MKRFPCTPVLICFFGLFSFASGQDVPERWQTFYEKSGFKKTPRYAETISYCRQLADSSQWIKFVSFGTSPEGRDLPLVIASREGFRDPQSARASGKAMILIQNGIHAGEIDGKDACFMLLRDIAITKTKSSLLDHLIFLVIPIFNVDGHERFGPYNRINQNGPDEMGWRVTSQNLNLNRDYMKADTPEMQAWLKMYNAWQPDFFIDCHVTDGADYQYTVTYGIETGPNVAEPVRRWIVGKYLPALDEIRTDGIPISPYVDFRDEHDPSKGLQGGTAPPRFSTIYVTLHNRPGLLIETHMLKEYKKRVDGTYAVIEKTAQVLNRDYQELRRCINDAESGTVLSSDRSFPLDFATLDTARTIVHFLGYKQTSEKSEISGTTKRVFSNERVEMDIPRYDSLRVTKFISPPVAYIVPQQWKDVIEKLRLHGIELQRLGFEAKFGVELYKFTDVKWQTRPFEGRLSLTYNVETMIDSVSYPAGTIIVPINQKAAKVAMHLLEPEAPDALVQWGFFNTIFEQKEYAEDYVLEKMAIQMLRDNNRLKAEFDKKVQQDSAFAKNPRARLQFFYQHSPYWDTQINIYPVARMISKITLPLEPLH